MADTGLKKLQQLMDKNRYMSNDAYEYIFAHRTPLTIKLTAFLAPDSKLYSSPLNPLFSWELEGHQKNWLKSFEMVSLRDGVFPLLQFFINHPQPESIDPIVVVDQELSTLVPEAWRAKVVLRQMVSTGNFYTQKKNSLLLFVNADARTMPLNILKEELVALQNEIENNSEVLLFFSSLNRKGEEDVQYDDAWKCKVMQVLCECIPREKIKVLSWQDYLDRDISGCHFYWLNPLRFYVSDSFLIHQALLRGALPLFESKPLEISHFIKLSAHHGFNLHQHFDTEDKLDLKILAYLNKFKRSEVFDNDDYAKLQLANDDMAEWASRIALDLYGAKNK